MVILQLFTSREQWRQLNIVPCSRASAESCYIHPLDVMRQAYQAMEITFQEDDGLIFTPAEPQKSGGPRPQLGRTE